MRKLLVGVCAALLGLNLGVAEAAEGIVLPERDWAFNGPIGHYEQADLQRGLQVYREVCSGCHGLKYIAFRNLADLGYNEDEIKALAAEYEVVDGPDDEGEMFERPGRPSDYFPSPFANKKAAAAANGGAVPPELSLIVKARFGGPDYIYGIMTGYQELPPNFKDLPEFDYLPENFEPQEELNFNKYFPGHQTAMAEPLFEDAVEYADGTEATPEQMAHDVASFLMWTADPKMEVRKSTGIKVIIFLVIMTIIFYRVKLKVWSDLH